MYLYARIKNKTKIITNPEWQQLEIFFNCEKITKLTTTELLKPLE